MLVIRLFRVGKKNQPFFKIVVTDKNNSVRCGRYVEQVGFVNPITKEKKLNQERIKYWISVGAKPSPTAFNLFITEKIIEGKKIPKHKKSKKPVEPVQATPAPAAAVPVAAQAPSPEPAEGLKAEDEKPAAEALKETKREEKKESFDAAQDKKPKPEVPAASASAEASADKEEKK